MEIVCNMQYMVQFYKENDQRYSPINDYEITKLPVSHSVFEFNNQYLKKYPKV